jgi:hypothetical protein
MGGHSYTMKKVAFANGNHHFMAMDSDAIDYGEPCACHKWKPKNLQCAGLTVFAESQNQ